MPSIKEKLEKSKCLKNVWLFSAISVVLFGVVLIGGYKLYWLSQHQTAVYVKNSAFETDLSGKEGSFVASKTGKNYYFPWCGMVNRIKDSNLVWFADRAAAEALGYVPASNCRGLK